LKRLKILKQVREEEKEEEEGDLKCLDQEYDLVAFAKKKNTINCSA
jgi:hypothetical protein